MRKIMFNDRYGLTQVVIEGRKTMTRRIMNNQYGNLAGCVGFTKKGRACTYVRADFDNGISEDAIYAIDEIVAVVQSYKSIANDHPDVDTFILQLSKAYGLKIEDVPKLPGWTNKMFVKPELMPHRIVIDGVCCERLQQISDYECLEEGISLNCPLAYSYGDMSKVFNTPREAFAALIDKVSGRGTWASNPWIVCYEFELVK